MINWLKKQWFKLAAVIGISVAFAIGLGQEPPVETPEIYCLGIIVNDTGLSVAEKNLAGLKGFVAKTAVVLPISPEGETNEQTFFTIKDSKNKNAEIRTFFAINGGIKKDVKDYFMIDGTNFLGSYGGLEFNTIYPESYMKQRLTQLMGEQGNCDKVYIHKFNDQIPSTIIDKFK